MFMNRPRVILVESQGILVGLVTVKDVLKFMATSHVHEPSWDERGGLDGLLEELWRWGAEFVCRILSSLRRLVRRRS
jgi:chloride channel 3/4/5